MVKLSRRGFLIGGAAVVGTVAAGMAIGVGFLSTVDTEGLEGAVRPDGTLALNAWITIRPDGHITFSVPRTEMGQGVYTALPMLIAEELEVDLDYDNVSVEFPTEPLPVYANFTLALGKRPEDAHGAGAWVGRKIFGMVPYIATGGSSSTVDAFQPYRRAGAAARSMLLQAAAKRWQMPVSALYAELGEIVNRETGERLGYGELAADAATIKPDLTVPLKAAHDFRLIGKSKPRLDIPAKVRGEADFGIDTVLPDMLFAVVVQAPVFGGHVKHMDDKAAVAMPHVHKVVNMGNAVGVIADSYYHARKGADALMIEFSDGGNGDLTSAGISDMLGKALAGEPDHIHENVGDVDATLSAGDVLEAEYETPYLAHACMEPMNCTALYKDGKAEMWMPAQSPLAMTWAAKDVFGDLPGGTVCHTTLAGGGFGRRIEKDAAVFACKLAAAMPGRPIKAMWPREEDIRHDMYRPAARARVRGALGADGLPAAFDYKIAVQSTLEGFSSRNMPITQGGPSDHSNVEGAKELPYAIPARRVSNATVKLPVPVGFWRSVGHSNNGYIVESFMDELAHKAGMDPFTYRQRMLAGNKRLSAMMDKLAELSGWHTPAPAGVVRGVSFRPSFRSYVAQVAEVRVGEDKSLKVEKVSCVVDCGQVVNPDTVKAQMEGGIIFALSALMFGEITLEGGAVSQSNFPDYDMVRMAQAPEIAVHIMDNHEPPGGVGEPGTPPLFAAVTNAIFTANGERVRSLPLMKHGYSFA